MVDPTLCDRFEDCATDRWVVLVTPPDQQCPKCVRVEPSGVLQHVAASYAIESLAGEHQRDVHARCGEALEPRASISRRAQALDPVVPSVAVAQLTVDFGERVCIRIDDQNHWFRHARIVSADLLSVRVIWILSLGRTGPSPLGEKVARRVG